jgi:two-component system KDP operon response regulator KdpE
MRVKGKVLQIDDDIEFSKLTKMWLQNAGYEVSSAVDGVDGLRRVFSSRPNLVLLDAVIPKMDGWEVCRRIREMCDIPVVMVTVRGQKDDRLRGFVLGADDYITKPVDFPELIARIQAILKRTAQDNQDNEQSSFHDGEIEVEWRGRQVWVRGKQVKLSPLEFRILACLIKNRGWIVTHEQILEKAWGPNYIGDKSFVKLYVRYLRKKIEADPHNPQLIMTERGVGYYFAMRHNEPDIPQEGHIENAKSLAEPAVV